MKRITRRILIWIWNLVAILGSLYVMEKNGIFSNKVYKGEVMRTRYEGKSGNDKVQHAKFASHNYSKDHWANHASLGFSPLYHEAFLPTVKVIVVAYYRGGSTFLGQLLNKNPAVNYYFEPFTGVFNAYKISNRISSIGDIYVDPNTLQVRPLPTQLEAFIEHAPRDVLDCRFGRLPSVMFEGSFFTSAGFMTGDHMTNFRSCMRYRKESVRQKPSRRYKYARSRHYTKKLPLCLHYLEEECRTRRVRGFKTIRMTLKQVYELLKNDTSIKVIYSRRNPLGMISSRYKITTKFHADANFTKEAGEMCARLREDVRFLNQLLKDYPRNVYVTKYEELCENLRDISDEIYNFLGLAMPGKLKTWIQEQVDKNPGRFEKWKSFLTASQINTTKLLCKDLL